MLIELLVWSLCSHDTFNFIFHFSICQPHISFSHHSASLVLPPNPHLTNLLTQNCCNITCKCWSLSGSFFFLHSLIHFDVVLAATLLFQPAAWHLHYQPALLTPDTGRRKLKAAQELCRLSVVIIFMEVSALAGPSTYLQSHNCNSTVGAETSEYKLNLSSA